MFLVAILAQFSHIALDQYSATVVVLGRRYCIDGSGHTKRVGVVGVTNYDITSGSLASLRAIIGRSV